ncbi:DUF4348 domain-containing protein [Prevotella sp. E13-17]|uniref:DUF4348 domain-containing protein n=1 Tax=Prevotella sp. E13-17 TaxID=2913616 RepID=UPI001EDAEB7F|nr:DUF4348 domain-containing protein [Prevotella sp. E13-17]UKK50200.1 DUF4348 domain-containing protein [Prevotella sp. E13-17]
MLDRFFLISLVVLLLAGCKGKHGAEDYSLDDEAADSLYSAGLVEGSADAPMPQSAEELFDDFIFNYASNNKLQIERTVFPLPVSTDSTIANVKSGTVRNGEILKQQWKMEKFFMKKDFYTLLLDNTEQVEQIKDTTISEVTVEHFHMNASYVSRYQFRRKDGKWRLTALRNQAFQRNPNASFLTFYHRFVTDSLFQRESLSDAIDFVGPDPEDDFSMMEGVITPDFWNAFAPELPNSIEYNIVYGHQNPASTVKVLVLRGIANGMEMELTFKLVKGRWKLTKLIT